MNTLHDTRIAVIVPCHNEEDGILNVVNALPTERARERKCSIDIIVIDNNSTDRTADVARKAGVSVIEEKRKGKGNAVRHAFEYISHHPEYDYIVMLDGDGSYDLSEMFRLIDPLMEGFGTVIIGSRIQGRIHEGSLSRFNFLGNWMFSHLVRYVFRIKVTDTLTGYFAWKRDAIIRLAPHLQAENFAIEMEMITKMARLGEEMYSVPVSYHKRDGEAKLRPILDGFTILFMFLKNLFWKPKKISSRKNIAFVSDAVMPYHNGGKERRLHEISTRLAKDGYDVHIYTMKWWDGPKTIDHEGVHFHAICKLHPLYTGERRSVAQGILFGLATFKLIFRSFDILDVDHIPFFPLFSGRIVAWIKRVPLRATWHEVWGRAYWKEYVGQPIGAIGSAVEQLSLSLPDIIISASEHTTKRLRAAGCKKNIITVPLGVDLKEISATTTSARTSDIIFVGRLIANKNVDLLIKALAEIKTIKPDITCFIIGDGPERERLEKIIHDLNLQHNAFMLGDIQTDKEKYALMKASKIFVFPSVREGFGLVAVEAQAAGLPVITTSHEHNATRDLIWEGVNGSLAEPNEQSIAEKILRVLEMRDMMDPTRDIEKYDWDVVTKTIARAFV